jgi:hypothetical protein
MDHTLNVSSFDIESANENKTGIDRSHHILRLDQASRHREIRLEVVRNPMVSYAHAQNSLKATFFSAPNNPDEMGTPI